MRSLEKGNKHPPEDQCAMCYGRALRRESRLQLSMPTRHNCPTQHALCTHAEAASGAVSMAAWAESSALATGIFLQGCEA